LHSRHFVSISGFVGGVPRQYGVFGQCVTRATFDIGRFKDAPRSRVAVMERAGHCA